MNTYCEVCGSPEGAMVPVMTMVPFSAPHHRQRYVCRDCMYVWYEYGLTTPDAIREYRNDTERQSKDGMVKPMKG